MTIKGQDFNEDAQYDLYDLFPAGADDGYGPDQGFNTFVRINDESRLVAVGRRGPQDRAASSRPTARTSSTRASASARVVRGLMKHGRIARRSPTRVLEVTTRPRARIP